MSIAGLICYFPAMTFPILTFKIGIVEQPDTMLSALKYFYEDGYPELAVLVFFTTVLAPLIQMILYLIVLVPLKLQRRPVYMKFFYKLLVGIRHWVMLDVYVIAILVAIIKLTQTAELIYESGLVMFLTLSVFSFLLNYGFSPRTLWGAYHHAK